MLKRLLGKISLIPNPQPQKPGDNINGLLYLYWPLGPKPKKSVLALRATSPTAFFIPQKTPDFTQIPHILLKITHILPHKK